DSRCGGRWGFSGTTGLLSIASPRKAVPAFCTDDDESRGGAQYCSRWTRMVYAPKERDRLLAEDYRWVPLSLLGRYAATVVPDASLCLVFGGRRLRYRRRHLRPHDSRRRAGAADRFAEASTECRQTGGLRGG